MMSGQGESSLNDGATVDLVRFVQSAALALHAVPETALARGGPAPAVPVAVVVAVVLGDRIFRA